MSSAAPERIKHQSNFYSLSAAVCKLKTPVTLQVIPSKKLTMFNDSENSANNLQSIVVTVVGEVSREMMRYNTSSQQKSSLPIFDYNAYVVPIDDSEYFESIGDIIQQQRQNKEIEWLVVTKEFTHKGTVYRIGQILKVSNCTTILSRVSLKKSKTLSVRMYPSLIKKSLPSSINAEFWKCSDPTQQMLKPLPSANLADSCPCLVKFPSTYGDKNLQHIENTHIYVTETFQEGIYLVCHRAKDSVNIYSIPSHIQINVEVLHGEIPVVSMTPHEVNIVKSAIIYNNLDKAKKDYQKFEISDILDNPNSDEFDLEVENEYCNREDLFQNADQNSLIDPDFDHNDGVSILRNKNRLTTKSLVPNPLDIIETTTTTKHDASLTVPIINKPLPPIPGENVKEKVEATTNKQEKLEHGVGYLELIDDESAPSPEKHDYDDGTTEKFNFVDEKQKKPVTYSSPHPYSKLPPKQEKDYVDTEGYMKIDVPENSEKQHQENNCHPFKSEKQKRSGSMKSKPKLPPKTKFRPLSLIFTDKKSITATQLRHSSQNTCKMKDQYQNQRKDSNRDVTTSPKHSTANYDYADAFEEIHGYSVTDVQEKQGGKSLQQDTSLAKISTLSVSEVSNLLKMNALHHHIELFQKNAIDGNLLVELREEDLKSLKLTDFEARKLYKYVNGWRPRKVLQISASSSEFTVHELSKRLTDFNLEKLAKFCVSQDIDGSLMTNLIQTNLVATLQKDYNIPLTNFEMVQLKKRILDDLLPKY